MASIENISDDNQSKNSFFSGVHSVEDCNFQIFNGQVNFNVHQPIDARSVTAFNSSDISAEQDNVATPVTAMMATVCISNDIGMLQS